MVDHDDLFMAVRRGVRITWGRVRQRRRLFMFRTVSQAVFQERSSRMKLRVNDRRKDRVVRVFCFEVVDRTFFREWGKAFRPTCFPACRNCLPVNPHARNLSNYGLERRRLCIVIDRQDIRTNRDVITVICRVMVVTRITVQVVCVDLRTHRVLRDEVNMKDNLRRVAARLTRRRVALPRLLRLNRSTRGKMGKVIKVIRPIIFLGRRQD